MTDKNAYPNEENYIPRTHPYNTDKWLGALRDIKTRCNAGVQYESAYEMATKGWEKKELRDFLSWVSFYEEQGHMKYKQARLYGYEGYWLPTSSVAPSPVPAPPNPKADENAAAMASAETAIKADAEARAKAEAAEAAAAAAIASAERQERLKDHRGKLLSRLRSLRKLWTDEKGKQLAGPSFGKFLDALNEIEKHIHGLHISNATLSSIIIRQANILAKAGEIRASEAIRKIADLPGGVPAANPSASIPNGGALGNNNPPLPGAAPPAAAMPDPEDTGEPPNESLLKFFNGLNGEDPFDDHDTQDDELDGDDNEVHDAPVVDPVEIDETDPDADLEVRLVTEGQAAPTAPAIPKPAPEAKLEELNTPKEPARTPKTENDPAGLKPSTDGVHPSKDFDSLIDAAFSNLKVGDIVKRLDDLSRIFKNREIARQLSIVDMMMDKLGLSSFFPSLAEATRSALESNQYCLVRIDEVKSRLSGALDTTGKSLHDMGQEHSIGNQQGKSDLIGEDDSPDDPLLDQVKNNLDQTQKKDKLRKELRKNIEENALVETGNKQKAEIADMGDELAAAKIVAPTVPAKPPVPPQV